MAKGWTIRAPSGRWKATYRDTSRRSHSKTFDRKTDAERWLRDQIGQLDRGTFVDPSLGRVRLDEYFEQYFAATAHIRQKTRDSYQSLAGCHICSAPIGSRRLQDITALDIDRFVGDLAASGRSPSTVSAAFRVLRLVLGTAERQGIIARNPAKGVRVPTPPRKEMRFLTALEVQAVADAVDERYRTLVLLLAYCGLRIGEAISLRPGDIDFLRRRLSVVRASSETSKGLILGETKTGTGRSMSVPPFLCDELAAHMARFPPVNRLIFTNSDGRPIRQSTFNRNIWHPAVRRAGIEAPVPRVHDLRHTAVAFAVAAGAHPKEIQARLGHSSITVTLDRYGHLFPGLDDRLAKRLDEIARDPRAADLLWAES